MPSVATEYRFSWAVEAGPEAGRAEVELAAFEVAEKLANPLLSCGFIATSTGVFVALWITA